MVNQNIKIKLQTRGIAHIIGKQSLSNLYSFFTDMWRGGGQNKMCMKTHLNLNYIVFIIILQLKKNTFTNLKQIYT